MESISALEAERIMLESQLKFITVEKVKRLFNVSSNTAHKMLMRWKKYGVINALQRNSYVLTRVEVNDYEIANQLVSPSYISLETALNYYGVLPQFPYTITSVTTRKSHKNICQNKEFEYAKISLDLFWGYEKQNDALIASPEKAVIDTLYLVSKGLRTAHMEEWDLTGLNRKTLMEYTKKVSYGPFNKLVKENNLT
jgi:predicted transcriptional regulator of viral defense system